MKLQVAEVATFIMAEAVARESIRKTGVFGVF